MTSSIQLSVLIVMLTGHGGSLHLTTTEEVAPIFTTIPEEEYEELSDLPEQTLKIYEDNFPSLFGRVTPTRIEDTLHELTTLKGLDDVGEVSQFSLFHGNDKKSNLDYNKVTGSFITRVKTGYLQNLKSTQSSSIVNDATRETLMDVVKNDEDDEVVEKIVDNPQTTTISSDIGVNQGEDDQQQYRHITDDTEQFMAEENDANKELHLNDLDSNHETLKKDKLDDKTNETEMGDIKQNAAVSYGDNLTFYTGPGDVVYDIIYDYHQPEIIEEEYQQSLDDGLILSTLESHNQVIGNTIEDENIDHGDSFNYKEPIEPLDYPDYKDTLRTDEEYYSFERVDADQRRPTEPVLEDNIYSQSRKSSSLVQDSEELFKIPFIMDFDAFGSETFSNARLRIPEQFQKLIHQPWTRGHAW